MGKKGNAEKIRPATESKLASSHQSFATELVSEEYFMFSLEYFVKLGLLLVSHCPISN